MDDLENRNSFEVHENTTDTVDSPVVTDIRYDLVGKLSEATQLTHKTVVAVLSQILPMTFEQFRINPEEFLSKAARLMNEQKAPATTD